MFFRLASFLNPLLSPVPHHFSLPYWPFKMVETATKDRFVLDGNLLIVFGVALMAVLRVDSISPAFPGISAAFDVTSQQTSMLISAFALPSVFLTPILGLLADRWGRKKVLVPSLLLFGIAGGASALVRDFNLLLALRLLQGIGGASLSMLNITLIADLYHGDQVTAAMGYNGSIRSLGSMIFPALGGLLAGFGWFYPFLLPLFALPAAYLVWTRLKNPEPSVHTGFVAYLGGAWQSLRSWQVAKIFIAGCMTFVMMYGAYLGYYPFLLSDKFQASPMVIGLLVSGRPLITALMASQLGRIAPRWGEINLIKAAFLFYALALLLIPLVPSLWMMVGVTLLFGLAEGLFWPSNFAMLGKLAPLEHRAGFMAINDMLMKLGQTLGPLLMGAAALAGGANATFFVASGLAVLTFFMLVRKR